jgi:hypothetical protein
MDASQASDTSSILVSRTRSQQYNIVFIHNHFYTIMKKILITLLAVLLLSGAVYAFLQQGGGGSATSSDNEPLAPGFMTASEVQNIFAEHIAEYRCTSHGGTSYSCVIGDKSIRGYQLVKTFEVLGVTPTDTGYVVKYDTIVTNGTDATAGTNGTEAEMTFIRNGDSWDVKVFDND